MGLRVSGVKLNVLSKEHMYIFPRNTPQNILVNLNFTTLSFVVKESIA